MHILFTKIFLSPPLSPVKPGYRDKYYTKPWRMLSKLTSASNDDPSKLLCPHFELFLGSVIWASYSNSSATGTKQRMV